MIHYLLLVFCRGFCFNQARYFSAFDKERCSFLLAPNCDSWWSTFGGSAVTRYGDCTLISPVQKVVLQLINLLNGCVGAVMSAQGREILQMDLLCCTLEQRSRWAQLQLHHFRYFSTNRSQVLFAILVLLCISCWRWLSWLSTLFNHSTVTLSIDGEKKNGETSWSSQKRHSFTNQ